MNRIQTFNLFFYLDGRAWIRNLKGNNKWGSEQNARFLLEVYQATKPVITVLAEAYSQDVPIVIMF